jgi:pyruvate/2-oxoglutarate/acetoin dehydrogenase E1 component
MTGMRPVAEIMFSDFLACCYDYLANEIPKMRYMTGGQVTVPLVVRTANGGGLGFGAQHSQAVENWVFTVPGLKIAAPSNPADVVGMMASAIRSDDPVVFFEHKGLFAAKGEPAPPDHVVPLGEASVARSGEDVTVVALASTVPVALEAAERLAGDGISVEVVDLRTLAGPRVCSWLRRTPTRAAGAGPWCPSWPTRASSRSTHRSAGWPPSACRCRSPTRSRTR